MSWQVPGIEPMIFYLQANIKNTSYKHSGSRTSWEFRGLIPSRAICSSIPWPGCSGADTPQSRLSKETDTRWAGWPECQVYHPHSRHDCCPTAADLHSHWPQGSSWHSRRVCLAKDPCTRNRRPGGSSAHQYSGMTPFFRYGTYSEYRGGPTDILDFVGASEHGHR